MRPQISYTLGLGKSVRTKSAIHLYDQDSDCEMSEAQVELGREGFLYFSFAYSTI